MYGNSDSFPVTANSIDEWLDAIRLGAYKENFRDVQLSQLHKLTNSELKVLVPDAGRRRRLLMAVQALSDMSACSGAQAEPEVKYNSTSSYYINSTISKPDTEEILFCVSLVIYDRICEGEETIRRDEAARRAALRVEQMLNVENKPLVASPADLSGGLLSEEQIFHMLRSIHKVANFSPECLVVSFLYTERFRSCTGAPILMSNWQPIFLASMVVAQKVWDDMSLLNVDFTVICSTYSLKDINILEMKFLELIEYDVSVKASVYAFYYFELRTLCEKADRPFSLKPLSEEGRKELESRSESIRSIIRKQRRSQSMGQFV